MRFIYILLLFLFPFIAFSQQDSITKHLTALDSSMARLDYDSANYWIHNIKTDALLTHDSVSYMKALVSELAIHNKMGNIDSVLHIANTELLRLGKVEQSIIYYLLAWNMLDQYSLFKYQVDSFSEAKRLTYINNIFFYYKEALKYEDELFNAKSTDWKPILNLLKNANRHKYYNKFKFLDDKSLELFPTLYHVLGYNIIDEIEQLNSNTNANYISSIKNKIEHYNKITNNVEASVYEYYRYNIAKINTLSFDSLFNIIKPYKANLNAQLLYLNINHTVEPYSSIFNQHVDRAIVNINRTLAEYPNTVWNDNLLDLLKEISASKLELEIPETYVSNEFIPLKINYANLDSIYIHVFKVADFLNSDSCEVDYDKELKQYNPKCPAIYAEVIRLKSFGDYEEHTTLYKINPLSPGVYNVIISNNLEFKDFDSLSADLNVLYIHNIAAISSIISTSKDHQEKYSVQLIDKVSGFPISNESIDLYVDDKVKKYKKIQTLRTNKDGFFEYKYNSNHTNSYDLEELYIYRKRTNEFLELYNIESVEPYLRNTVNAKPSTSNQLEIFTDRAIYRPGQLVYFKGILYVKNELTSTVVPNQKVTIYLIDANKAKIDSTILTTNDFGSINSHFTIPQHTLNGQFKLAFYQNDKPLSYEYFKVESYKRPTFKVSLLPVLTDYKSGDTAIFSGSVSTLSGAPLVHTKVSYRIYDPGYKQREFIDTVITDQKGCFNIKHILPEASYIQNIHVTATVISTTGEKQVSNQLRFRYSDFPYVAGIAIEKDTLTQSLSHALITIRNYNDVQIPMKGTYAVYRLEKGQHLFGNHQIDFKRDFDILPEDSLFKYFGKYDYNINAGNNRYWKQQNKVLTGTFDTEITDTLFIPKTDMESGQYIIVSELVSATNDTVFNYNVFNIKQKDFPIYGFLSLESKHNNHNIGDEMTINLRTDFKDDVVVYFYIKHDDGRVNTKAVTLREGVGTFIHKVSAYDFKHKLNIECLMIKNNQYYHKSFNIPIYKEPKKLDITTTVFRDKIVPGTKETWSLKVNNTEDGPVSAEVLATMYDASLDQFKAHQFSRGFNSYYNYNYTPDMKYTLRSNWPEGQVSYLNLYENNYSAIHFYSSVLINTLIYNEKLLTKIDTNIVNKINLNASLSYLNFSSDIDELLGVTISSPYSGSVSKLRFVGSAERIGAENIEKISVTDFAKALAGNAPGVQVTSSGTNETIKIRGFSSLKSDEVPLIIMDGSVYTGTMSDINTYDIANIDVLKDATSTALYGSRGANGVIVITTKGSKEDQKKLDQVAARKQLQETAFFYPELYTDSLGNVTFEFTTPEALTQWKMLVFAHDKSLNAQSETFQTKTQKDIMVAPYFPRYIRTGDVMTLNAHVYNMIEDNVNALGRMSFIDPITNEDITHLFNVAKPTLDILINGKNQALLSWEFTVPDGLEDVIIKIVASTGQFSDGEQVLMPILPNKVNITSVEPFVVLPNESKTIQINDTFGTSTTKIDIDAHPLMNILSSLRQLATYPYECTEQLTSKWFAYQMLRDIITEDTAVRTYFQRIHQDTTYKTLLAQAIGTQKTSWDGTIKTIEAELAALAVLMNKKNLDKAISDLEHKILSTQTTYGTFPWFEGGKANIEITKQILTYIGRVLRSDKGKIDEKMKKAYQKGVLHILNQTLNVSQPQDLKLTDFIDAIYIYQLFPEDSIDLSPLISKYDSLFKRVTYEVANKALAYRAKAGIVSHFLQSNNSANVILKSIQLEMRENEILGAYWENNTNYHLQTPIATQSLLIELYQQHKLPTQPLLQWVYTQHNAKAWHNTISINHALYSLLSTTDIKYEAKHKLSINGLDTAILKENLGRYNYSSSAIPNPFTVVNNQSNNVFSSVSTTKYVAYEDVKSNSSAVKIEKTLLRFENNHWIPVGDTISVGENLKVRIQVRLSQPASYIHIKDWRAAGLDPVYQPSGYQWNKTVAHYFEIKDAETNFFIDDLPIGEHIFEYEVKAAHKGIYNTGLSRLESMYNSKIQSNSAPNVLIIK